MKISVMIFITFVVFVSCTSKVEDTRSYIELDYPDYFPKPNLSVRNPLTKEGVFLGEKLFFETLLSENNNVSCATCHIPELSFSDGVALSSFGVSGEQMKRNSPALINLAWMDGLFWDGGAHNLESQPFAALTNASEMGTNLMQVSVNLNADDTYRELFKKAFDIDSISSAYIVRALAQYQRTLVLSNSKYDKYMQGKRSLTNEEQIGFDIFNDQCASCHVPPLFTDNLYHNNGLDSIFPSGNLDILKGRYRITLDSSDLGKYKTPTLRNLKYTAPYMHDGRFATLDDVFIHYQYGVIHTTTLDTALVELSLNDDEIEYILVFLETLNEEVVFIK